MAATSWNDVLIAVPDLARATQARFEAHGMGLLATLRADGSPRISGIEVLFHAGELWMGMMPGSRKDADVRRDPRVALHSATVDKDVAEGDARLSGRLLLVDDEATFAVVRDAFAEHNGAAPEGPFPLYRLDVTEVMMLRPATDHLVIESWTPSGGYTRVERH